MDILIGLTPLMLSGGDPFQEPSGLQRRRLPQVLGTGGSWHCRCHQFAHADALTREYPIVLVQDAQPSMQSLASGQEEGLCTINCLMSPPVSSVDYYRLAQIWGHISCPVWTP